MQSLVLNYRFYAESFNNVRCLSLILACCLNGQGDGLLFFARAHKEYVVGDLKKQSLVEIWNSKKMSEFRKRVRAELEELKDYMPCNICRFKNSCFGDCPAISFQEDGRMIRPNQYCVQAYMLGLAKHIIARVHC